MKRLMLIVLLALPFVGRADLTNTNFVVEASALMVNAAGESIAPPGTQLILRVRALIFSDGTTQEVAAISGSNVLLKAGGQVGFLQVTNSQVGFSVHTAPNLLDMNMVAGRASVATSFGSYVLGSMASKAGGSRTVVLGGAESECYGGDSIAAGYRAVAKLEYSGSFIWSCGTHNVDLGTGVFFTNSADRSFQIYPRGGVWIGYRMVFDQYGNLTTQTNLDARTLSGTPLSSLLSVSQFQASQLATNSIRRVPESSKTNVLVLVDGAGVVTTQRILSVTEQ